MDKDNRGISTCSLKVAIEASDDHGQILFDYGYIFNYYMTENPPSYGEFSKIVVKAYEKMAYDEEVGHEWVMSKQCNMIKFIYTIDSAPQIPLETCRMQ